MEQDDGRVAVGEQALLASLPEPVPVSALTGDDPSRSAQIVRELTSLPAWSDGRRPDVVKMVMMAMDIYRDSVAEAQKKYERDCGLLADYMTAFSTLSHMVAADASEVLLAQAIEARSGATGTGSIGEADESAVATPCAQGDAE